MYAPQTIIISETDQTIHGWSNPTVSFDATSRTSPATDVNLAAGAGAAFTPGGGDGDEITGAIVTTDDYEWTGAQNTNFANANNWDAASAGIDPAPIAPGVGATVRFDGAGGTITGTGTVDQLYFAGTGQWVVNGASLESLSDFADTGLLSLRNGGTIQTLGTDNATIEGAGASVIVTGAGSEIEAGTGTVVEYGSHTLQVGGSIAGTLDILAGGLALADATYIGAAGSILVQGVNSALNTGVLSDTGTLSVTGGASIIADSLALGQGVGNARVIVDSGSGILLGTGSLTAGAVTVGPGSNNPFSYLYGVGTIASNLINNGVVTSQANSSNVGVTLEITGSVSGTGTLRIEGGYQWPSYSGQTYSAPTSVLQLDGAVGAGQTIAFYSGIDGSNFPEPTLNLLDPTGFHGTIAGFAQIGDSIDLIGDTIASAAVSGSMLGVTLVGGVTLSFSLAADTPPIFVQTSGSVITSVAPPVYAWTGATNTNCGTASNWQEVSPTTGPAVSAPNASETAEFLGSGGTIAGTGNAGTLIFAGSGPWVVGPNADLTGSQVSMQGTVSVAAGSTLVSANGISVGSTAPGNLQVTSGGKVIAQYLALGANGNLGTIAVDAASMVEIGTTDTDQADAITVDAWNGTIDPLISGVGLIAGNLVDNNFVQAGGAVAGQTLEVTGSVSGTGMLVVDAEQGYTFNGTFVADEQATTLRLDSAVAAGVQVEFGYTSTGLPGGTLVLADPADFAGSLTSFSEAGDTLVLPGESLVAASFSGSDLQVTLAAGGGSFDFEVSDDDPVGTAFSISGSVITVSTPPIYVWTGAAGSNFATAGSWDDITDGENPATVAPGVAAITEFLSGGGTIAGTGSVSQILFGGPAPWVIASGANLSGNGGLTVDGVLSINSGATITSDSTVSVGGTTPATASLTVSGLLDAGDYWVDVGSTTAPGLLAATNGGTILVEDVDLGSDGVLGTLAADATSSIVIGPGVSATAGAVSLGDSEISGDGTIAANLVNNGWIYTGVQNSGNTLEVTGTVSGSGWIDADSGYASISGGTTTYIPGVVLQLDGVVGSGQDVEFATPYATQEAATVRLLDPIGFAGTLWGFNGVGDQLVLPGETMTSAVVVGSTLEIGLAGGGTLAYAVAGTSDGTPFSASGSVITVAATPIDLWTGALGTNFGTAGNWDDILNDITPAAGAPGSGATAEFLSGEGTITGTGSIATLLFGGTGPWTLASGASLADSSGLTINRAVTIDAGSTMASNALVQIGATASPLASLDVSGLLSAYGSDFDVGTSTGSGLLAAVNGGMVIAGDVTMGGDGFVGTLAADATSAVIIGSLTGAAGAVTVAGDQISGDGVIAANLENDGWIYADAQSGAGNTLEVTGAVTGSGWIYIESGYSSASNGTTVYPTAVLQFDGSVSSGQTISFWQGSSPHDAPALRLLDPSGFDGSLDGFYNQGDQLILPGQSVVSAVLNGSTLEVQLAGGGSFAFSDLDASEGPIFSASGSVITVLAQPTDVWTGAAGTDFGTAGNWDDIENNLDPAASAPSVTTSAEFLSNGGTITGSGSASQLVFSGASPWFLTNGGSISAAYGFVDQGTLTVEGGAAITSADYNGTVASSTALSTASMVVTGNNSAVQSVDLNVGDGTGGGLASITDGGTISASYEVDIGNGTVTVSGADSDINGFYMIVGDTEAGTLAVSNGGSATLGELYDGMYGGTGVITASGSGSNLSASEIYVGYDVAGTLNVSGGASVSATGIDIGYSSGGAGVVIATGGGTIDAWNISVGFEANAGTPIATGTLTIAGSASVIGSDLGVDPMSVLNDTGGLINVGTLTNAGTIDVANVNTMVVASLANSGQIFLAGDGTLLHLDGELTNDGSIGLVGGTLATSRLSNDSGADILGFGTINGVISDVGTIVAQGGLLVLGGPVTGSAAVQIAANATLEIAGAFGASVAFDCAVGTLKIDQPTNFSGQIAGLTNGDTIDLADVVASSVTNNSGTLIVGIAGGGTLAYGFVPLSGSGPVKFASDGAGGTNIFAGPIVPDPTISATVSGQTVIASGAIPLFSDVTIADPNVGQTETVTVTLSSAANGRLTNLGTGNYNATEGVYTVTGSVAAVTTALYGLIFDPSGAGDTTFTISDTDTAGGAAVNDATSVIATSGPQVINVSNGSYVFTYYPIATASQTIAQYSGSNGSGALQSFIVNNTSGTSYLFAYNPAPGATQTVQEWSSFNTSDGAPSGSLISDVVNYTDGETMVYAYNPTSTVLQTAELWSGTNADGSPIGAPISDVVNNTDGTTLVYAYNPGSGVAQTTTEWSATNPDGSAAGNKISAVVDNIDGTAIVYAYNPASGETQTASYYASYDAASGAPTGNLTSELVDYTAGLYAYQSALTTYNASGNPTATTDYSGPDASGSVVSTTTYALPPTAGSSSADSGTIQIAGTGQVVDPGFGSQTIQFLSAASDDTLVLHTGGTDTVSGFDPSAGNQLDLRALFSESGISLTSAVADLSAYINVAAVGSDAAVLFDPTGQGGGSAVATLTGDASLVPLLKSASVFVV